MSIKQLNVYGALLYQRIPLRFINALLNEHLMHQFSLEDPNHVPLAIGLRNETIYFHTMPPLPSISDGHVDGNPARCRMYVCLILDVTDVFC